MKANKKFIQADDHAVSAVIGVILMVAITVAIAATVYVYVTGMIGTGTTQSENAAVTVKGDNQQLRITLAQMGSRMPSGGYLEATWKVFVDGAIIVNTGLGAWDVGASWVILDDGAGTLDFTGLTGTTDLTIGNEYAVTVNIMDTVVYDGTIVITG